MGFCGTCQNNLKIHVKKSKFYLKKSLSFKDTVVIKEELKNKTVLDSNNSITNYEEIKFEINSLFDMIKLWDEIKNVSLNTYFVDKSQNSTYRFESFSIFDYVKNNSNQTGEVVFYKSDNQGAGGFDSSLSIHTKRSWIYNSVVYSSKITKEKRLRRNLVYDQIKNNNKKHDNDDDNLLQLKNLKFSKNNIIDDSRSFTPLEDLIVIF